MSDTMVFIHTYHHEHEHTFAYLIRVKFKRTSFCSIIMASISQSIIPMDQTSALGFHTTIHLVMDNHISIKIRVRELPILLPYSGVILQGIPSMPCHVVLSIFSYSCTRILATCLQSNKALCLTTCKLWDSYITISIYAYAYHSLN